MSSYITIQFTSYTADYVTILILKRTKINVPLADSDGDALESETFKGKIS